MTDNPVVELALDTLRMGKQALVFVHSKASAEKTAEEIAHAIKKTKRAKTIELAKQCLSALEKPTKQCERLAASLDYGIAFHHAGLPAKQRGLVEDEFRKGAVKIICCTPTLAIGINLPSFRALIRDVKRYTLSGMDWIPQLEYEQMAGRCGRPDFHDTHGEAIVLVSGDRMKDDVFKRYISGKPEEIYSKLAVEPVLRTYILSLIATHFFTTKQQLYVFFEKSFWAYQYKDMPRLRQQLDKMLLYLLQWGFLEQSNGSCNGFLSALSHGQEEYHATLLGKRVAELYLDPLTAFYLVQGLRISSHKTITAFSLLHLISTTLEMRPYLSVGVHEAEKLQEMLLLHCDELLREEEEEDFLGWVKTALFFHDWVHEANEDTLYETYHIRPGEIHIKLERADWLLFALGELAKVISLQHMQKQIALLRTQLIYGVKEELLPMIRFAGIGKIRARLLYTHGIRDAEHVKKIAYSRLSALVGQMLAKSLKQQVGIIVEEHREEKTTLQHWSSAK